MGNANTHAPHAEQDRKLSRAQVPPCPLPPTLTVRCYRRRPSPTLILQFRCAEASQPPKVSADRSIRDVIQEEHASAHDQQKLVMVRHHPAVPVMGSPTLSVQSSHSVGPTSNSRWYHTHFFKCSSEARTLSIGCRNTHTVTEGHSKYQ